MNDAQDLMERSRTPPARDSIYDPVMTARAVDVHYGDKHAVRNALNPMITILGYDIAALLSGFALVENIIGWPGLGQMMLEALQSMDMPLAMAGMMIGAFMLLVGNLLADVMLSWVDPRIKLEA